MCVELVQKIRDARFQPELTIDHCLPRPTHSTRQCRVLDESMYRCMDGSRVAGGHHKAARTVLDELSDAG